MKFLLILSAIVTVSLGFGLAHAQEENIVLLYKFDEDMGDTAVDLSGKGNDGVITDAEWTPDGKFGGGIVFNGTSSVIEVPHDDSLLPGGDQITIMAWYNPASLPAGYPAIARKGAVAEMGWGFDTPNGNLRGFVYLAATQAAVIATGSSVLETDEWQHVAMIYDGEEIRVYLNGKLDGNIDCSGDINENGSSVWISKKANENNFLDGIMDDLAILNVALTEAQLKAFMNGGISMAVESSGKLAISWGQIKISK